MSAPVLTFLGATGTVTGSRFLLDAADARVLVDCGLYQGGKPLRRRNWEPFPVDPSTIDAVVVTHAHLDHTGYLPALATHGFAGPIYATRNTVALSGIVLPDSGHLQEEDAAFANRMGFSKHRPALPLYTEADAYRVLLHHLARFLPDHRNTMVLAGFQAAGTRGRRLQEGTRVVKMLGRYVPVRAEILDVTGLSVHADRSELLAWLGSAPAAPETTLVVHGESEASRALRDSIEAELGWTAAVPVHGERVRLD